MLTMKENEFGFWFWVHAVLLVPAYLSPIFFDWKLIVLGVVILQIQYWLIDGCILTHLEMGKDKNETFIWYYLVKIFPTLNAKKTKFFIRIMVPIFLIIAGYIMQEYFGLHPFIKIF
jgi:hypothetical protein